MDAGWAEAAATEDVAAWRSAETCWDGDPRSPVLREWTARRTELVREWVAARSVFYGERARRLGERWHQEFTTKQDLAQAGQDIFSGGLSDIEVYYETTGTTGPPTPCPRAPVEVWTSNRSLARAWTSMLSEDACSPVVAIMGPSELYAFGDVFGAVARELKVPHVKLWPDSPRVGPAKALRLLRDLKVTHVVCAPSMVLELARHARSEGLDPECFSVRRFLVLGELTTPEFRANAAGWWPGSTVAPAMYGSQEAMCVAAGWPDGMLRLNELNYHFEVVDPIDGSPVTGQVGELVVTSLVRGVKPLIRYRTGDLVAVDDDRAACYPGRTVTILGRTADQVQTGSGNRVTAYDVERAAIEGVTSCLGYQVRIARDRSGNHATLRLLVADPEARKGVAAKALERLLAMPTTVEFPAELEERTRTGATVSWKAARLVEERNT